MSELQERGPAGRSDRVTLAAQTAIVIVLGVAVALGLSAMLRGTSPAPAPVAASLVLGSPSPVVTGAPATPSPSPSPTTAPTPTPRPTRTPVQQVAVDRFLALIAKPNLAYHMDVSGSSSAGTFRNRFRYSLDVSGGDFRGTLTTRDLAATCNGVRKSSRIYAWCPNGVRGSRDDSDGLWSFWPFMGLTDGSSLNPPALVKVNGTTLVHVTSRGSYATGIDRMLNLNQHPDTGYPVSVELWITTAGVPVKAIFRVGPLSVAEGTLTGKATYVFTHVGRKVVIRAPW